MGIAKWAHGLPVSVRVRLGIGRRAPSESTFRRVLQTVDAHALDTAVSSWLVERSGLGRKANQALRAVAVDGKTARGSRAPDQPARHLFAAFEHANGVVLGQTEVDDKSNEITAFAPLLDRIDLTGTVITADALHTQDRHATYLHQRGGHYVFIVKNNRPKLRTQLAGLPWRDIPALDLSQDKGMAGWSHAPSNSPPLAPGSSSRTPSSPLRSCAADARPPAPRQVPGTPRPSTRSPTSASATSAPTSWPRSSATTGQSRTNCTGSET